MGGEGGEGAVAQMWPRAAQYALRGEGRNVDCGVRVRSGAAACSGSVSGLLVLSMQRICRCFMNSVECKHHLGAK